MVADAIARPDHNEYLRMGECLRILYGYTRYFWLFRNETKIFSAFNFEHATKACDFDFSLTSQLPWDENAFISSKNSKFPCLLFT